MKNAAHQYEDKLLEFAYGELPQHEADAVDAHVRGCARCNEALGEIRGVRATMAQLPMEAAPDAGLDSLLAYAEQAAKRNAQGEARPSFFKKFLMPLASLMALATVGVVAWRANQEFDTSPAAVAADLKADEYAARAEQQKQQSQPPPPPQQVVQKELEAAGEGKGATPAPATVAPVAVAAAQPNEKEQDRAELRERAQKLEQVAVPESVTRRNVTKSKVAREDAPVEAPADDWSNVAKRGALRDNYSDGVQGGAVAKDQAPGRGGGGKTAPVGTRGPSPANDAQASSEEPEKAPPPEAKKPADKTVGFGLGSGALDADTAVGGLGTSGTGDSTGAYKKRAKAEPKAEPTPAVVATTPAPAAPPPPKPSQSTKSSLALPSMRGYSSAPSTGTDEEVAVEKSDAKRLDDDAKFDARRAAAARTQSLEQARVASNRGDRTSEIQLLLQVLKTGATGSEKAEALKRLCDAFEALGEYDTGDRYCDQLLVEFPDTVAAKVVTQRRNATQRMPAKTPAAAERKRADQFESNKPAEAAPTQAQ